MGGGKGISIVSNVSSLKKAILKAKKSSKSKQVIIEQFVEGQLHSITTYMKNNKVLFYHHDNELTFQNPFNVHSSFAPSTLPKNKINQIFRIRNVRKLNLTDGILHARYVNQLDFFIIELTRRCSGDLYPVPVEMVTNVPWSKVILKSFIKKVNIPKSKGINKMYARHCLILMTMVLLNQFIDSKSKRTRF